MRGLGGLYGGQGREWPGEVKKGISEKVVSGLTTRSKHLGGTFQAEGRQIPQEKSDDQCRDQGWGGGGEETGIQGRQAGLTPSADSRILLGMKKCLCSSPPMLSPVVFGDLSFGGV